MTTNNKKDLDFQIIICLNCGSTWRIERYTPDVNVAAELLVCPLCESEDGEKHE